MFSQNGQISIRQTYRLLFFDLVGVGTLLLPKMLANLCKGAGIWSIIIGALLAYGYLIIVDCAIKRMKTDLLSYIKKHRIVLAILWINAIVAAGMCAYVFTDLVRSNLVPEESFETVLILILIVSAYAVSGGIECRARVYEILFWFVIIPLFFMLFFAAGDLKMPYLTQMFNLEETVGIIKGSYLVFISFSTLFYLLMFPAFVSPKNVRHLKKAGTVALILASMILFVTYMVLVGSFGGDALSYMKYPAVTLMSTVKMDGMFLKRTDAFMLGIWFFTLYALLNINLFYGIEKLKKIVGKGGRKRYVAIVAALVYVVAEFFEYGDGMMEKYLRFLGVIGVPILVIIPIAIIFAGCNSTELEDRCFPMLAAVDKGESLVDFSYVFPELGFKEEKEPQKLYINNGGVGVDFKEARSDCESGLVKKADGNHLKILLLGEKFYEDKQAYTNMLKNLQSEESFPRNAYVCIASDVEDIKDSGEELSEDVGTYLEQLLEKKQSENGLTLVTIGDLIDENDNDTITYQIPYVKVDNDKIVIQRS